MLTRISLNFCLEVEIALGSDPLLQRLVDPDGRVQLVQTDLKRSKVALIGSDLSVSKIVHRDKSQNWHMLSEDPVPSTQLRQQLCPDRIDIASPPRMQLHPELSP